MRFLALLSLFPALLLAQSVSPGLIDRSRLPDGSPPLTQPAADQTTQFGDGIPMADPSPGDNDLGVQLLLKRQQRARMFQVMANLGIFATDNAARLPTNEVDDVYMAALIGVGFQPALGQNWFLDLGLNQEFYRYDQLTRLDFESTTASAGVIRVVPEFHNFMLSVNYTYRRMTNGDFNCANYTNQTLALTAQKVFVIDRKNSWYLVGATAFDLQADPDVLKRNEYSVQAAYDYRLSHTIKLSAYYRFGYRDYRNADIDESNNILGAAAIWMITDSARFEVSASWIDNNSQNNNFDYTAGTGGLAANLRVLF